MDILVYGVWYCVYGVWYCVYGVWYCVYGVWYCVYGIHIDLHVTNDLHSEHFTTNASRQTEIITFALVLHSRCGSCIDMTF